MKIKQIIVTGIIALGITFGITTQVMAQPAVTGVKYNDVTFISELSQDDMKRMLPIRLKELAPTLYQIEHSDKPINAIFLTSIMELETGYGSSYSCQYRNNVGGIKGWNGFKTFSSKRDSLLYMQDFLNRLYINQGRKTIYNIGNKYCVGGNWAYKIKKLINVNSWTVR